MDKTNLCGEKIDYEIGQTYHFLQIQSIDNEVHRRYFELSTSVSLIRKSAGDGTILGQPQPQPFP